MRMQLIHKRRQIHIKTTGAIYIAEVVIWQLGTLVERMPLDENIYSQ